MAKISKFDLEQSIKDTEAMQANLIRNKYTGEGEHTWDDIVDRMIKLIESKGSNLLTEKDGRHRFGYTEKQKAAMVKMLKEGYFVPGGSIISGTIPTTDESNKSSLSNCYVLQIKHDSIEGICDCIREACRTYSYRGGVGIDITILRPDGAKVHNAAKSSSGAVSFMPMISQANATIGTNGRRAAMMISIDCRHPDVEQFIWSKADPHAVFTVTRMSHDVSANLLQKFLAAHPNLDPEVSGDLNDIAWKGKVPDVNTANISVKFTDEFMQKVKDRSPEPWICYFPDIEADKKFYEEKWDGDYEHWQEAGGKLKAYDRHYLFITDKNYKRFIGRTFIFTNDEGEEYKEQMTNSSLKELLQKNNNYYRATIKNPSAYQIFLDLAMAAFLRGDPGVLFWNKHCDWTTFSYLDPILKPMTTNPCYSADTRVLTINGYRTFKELVEKGEDIEVPTMDPETKEFRWEMARNPRITRGCCPFVRITFDNGDYLDVTTDHKCLVNDDTKVLAKDVKSGDSMYSYENRREKHIRRTVVSVDPIGNFTAYNITVDNTHLLYVMTGSESGNPKDYVISPNCGEENLFPYSSCLLGAQNFPRYVKNPWSSTGVLDWNDYIVGCYNGALLMQFFSDCNEDRHPLPQQIEMEKYAKRIGVEFTGLADALSMVGINYGTPEAEKLASKMAAIKNYMEFCCSVDIAKQLGPCQACDPKKNLKGLENMMAQEYFKSAMDGYKLVQDVLSAGSLPEYMHLYTPEQLKEAIKETGLRNVAFNTVGPTGSISIVAGNCSSGIEPVFALFYTRYTRVGDRDSYNVCHAPIARYLLDHWETLGYNDNTTLDSEDIKKTYHIVEAHELDYHQRIRMQMAIQRYCDSSISSTVNLPESSTPEDIVTIYLEAWETGLKGITIFRTGSLNSVLEIKTDDDEEEEKETDTVDTVETYVEPAVPTETVMDTVGKVYNSWGTVVPIPDKILSMTHTVHWRGAKFYVIVSVDERKRPMQMFISSLPRDIAIDEKGQFNNESYHNQLSIWTALMRIISISLRAGVDPKVIVKQLRKSSFTMVDVMSVIARVLDEYTGEHGQSVSPTNLTECPECHKKALRHEGGCTICQECGYSKCS